MHTNSAKNRLAPNIGQKLSKIGHIATCGRGKGE